MHDEEPTQDDINDIVEYLEGLPAEVVERLGSMVQAVLGEMLITHNKEHDVVFCGSNGRKVVKCVHYDRSVLDTDGPVLLPSSNNLVLLAAVSTQSIEDKVSEFRNMYPDPEACEHQWQLHLDGLAEAIAGLAKNAAPIEWEELLLGSGPES